jgi:primosomal protein N' (replication factor Y)
VFARVAFPLALPEPLSYAVPDSLALVAVPGTRVRARVRGAPRIGLLVELTSEPGCDTARLLEIEEVLDPEPVVPGHVLELARFVADYYLAGLGRVLRAAVPAGLMRVPPSLVELGPRAVELLERVEPAQRRLLERLLQARRLTIARLLGEGWGRSELQNALSALAACSAVKVVERQGRRVIGATVAAVALARLDGAELVGRIGRAPAQRRVVDHLVALGGPALVSDLVNACGCSAAVVAELVRKGVLKRFEQAKHARERRWELAALPAPSVLAPSQTRAIERLTESLEAGGFAAFLLLGVTGSGKTEVYLRAAQSCVDRGRQAVILVPEIGLTPALAGQLGVRFGERVAILHSSMSDGDRFAAWERIRRGQVDVVAGPRSALWAPLGRLGMVVVDEEQDSSYKQDEEPRYNARDVALVLGQKCGIPVVLATATPSLETLALVQQGRVEALELPERVSGGVLPSVEVVDLRNEPPERGEHGQRFLSRRVRVLLAETLERGQQAIVLVNRRGWAPILLCRECGRHSTCSECSIPMTVHRRSHALLCHYCGARRPLPVHCPSCNGEVLDHVGAGTEKIAERVGELFPGVAVDILDRDTARSPTQLIATLQRFASGETAILVGTQMVSKGHHFPRVTLTVVVSADNLLGFPDFRGAERTFQLLTQVAGRAGRGEQLGRVVIQSYHPDHHAIRAAVDHDVAAFAAEELRYRAAFRFPPSTHMALVRWEAERENAALGAAEEGARRAEPLGGGVRLVGPAPAPIARLRGRWRVQLLLTCPSRAPLRQVVARIAAAKLPSGVRRVLDIDPLSTT